MKDTNKTSGKQKDSNYLIPLGIMIFLLLLSLIFVPGFMKARERANERACYNNQKTIAGAIEIYEEANNTEIKAIDVDLFRRLKEEKILKKLPTKVCADCKTNLNYALVGKKVFCINHGSIQGLKGNSGKPPRRELVLAGVKDEALIKRSAAKFGDSWFSRFFFITAPLAWLICIVLFVLEVLRLVYKKGKAVHNYIATGEE